MRYFLSIYLLVQSWIGYSQVTPIIKLKSQKKINLQIPEPSDICLNHTQDGFYIVSDNGYLYATNLEGNVLKKANYRGADFEAVWINYNNNEIIVSDESLRRFEIFDVQFNHLRTQTISIAAGRNQGIEAGTFHSPSNYHLTFTEKNPATLIQLDKDLDTGTKQLAKIKGITEVAACSWYKGYLWILSDENRIIYQTNYNSQCPEKTTIVNRYRIPVLNPEGLCFLTDNTLVVASDDLEKIFFFEMPSKL